MFFAWGHRSICQPLLTYHLYGSVALTWEQFHKKKVLKYITVTYVHIYVAPTWTKEEDATANQ